jgi:lipopolysaccharide export LptBFGC system permease protein LptF
MKKIIFPLIMLFAIVIALNEQSKENINVYIMIAAIVVFFYGMMRLSSKTPSKNQDKDNEDV